MEDIYKKTKESLLSGKFECGCGQVGRIGEAGEVFSIYEDNPENLAIYFVCNRCGRKYYSSMPGHIENTSYQFASNPLMAALRILNKIIGPK